MHSRVSLTIPQPCHQSWAAMIPIAAGRHCAACPKTVVDFTRQTDAEILAYLAGAASNRTCGRFAAGQLERPLRRAAPAAPTRWRVWLAAAVAVWGVREGVGELVEAQTPIEMRVLPARGRQDERLPGREVAAPELILRGIVLDSLAQEGLPGVTVLIKNSSVGASTNHDGAFELLIPARYAVANTVELVISSIGYVTENRRIVTADTKPLQIRLRGDAKELTGLLVVLPSKLPPAPWHPRRFYYWSKYWLTRSFCGD